MDSHMNIEFSLKDLLHMIENGAYLTSNMATTPAIIKKSVKGRSTDPKVWEWQVQGEVTCISNIHKGENVGTLLLLYMLWLKFLCILYL